MFAINDHSKNEDCWENESKSEPFKSLFLDQQHSQNELKLCQKFT